MAGTSRNSQDASNEIIHDRSYYADELRCFVPSCKKYRRDNPSVNFLRIPMPLKVVWCQAVERNCPKMPLYVCDEHINIDEDCYRTKSGRLRLKSTANLILSTTCYEDIYQDKKYYCPGLKLSPYYISFKSVHSLRREGRTNKQAHFQCKMDDSEETMVTVPTSSTEFVYEYLPDQKCDAASQCQIERKNKAVTAKPAVSSIKCTANIQEPSMTGKILASQLQQLSPIPTSCSSTPTLYQPSPSHSITSSYKENVEKDLSGRNSMLRLIKENPKKYIGIPEQYYWLVDFLAEECKLRQLHIIITLFKIRYNDDIMRICDHFNYSEVTVIEMFKVCMPGLATYLQSFIYLPEEMVIKKTLPPVFKPRYANVKCIIDCFEIEIEKPSDTVTQSGTWSQYKSCNTAKYVIACCPNGFICYISKGYGGRISDKAITESCGFLDILPPGAVVLADRGFKGIGTHLRERHLKLLRPPSVSSKQTPTKKEVLLGKVIASLRIHVERLIRRVREFRFLKPHSVINHSHMRYLDESVIIACPLVNLQDNLIKID